MSNVSVAPIAYEVDTTESINGSQAMNTTSPTMEPMGEFEFILYGIVVPILFGLVTLVGVSGNTLVVWVIVSRNKMRTVTNILLLNLAIADISFVLICPPFTAYQFATNQWPFGDIACKLMHYLLNVTAYVTVYTLVLISVLRYLTILHGPETAHYRTKSNVVKMIIGLWMFMLACNAPVLFTHGRIEYGDQAVCENYGEQYGRGLFATFFVFAYILPLLIVAALSIAILVHINKQKPTMVGRPKRKSDDKKKQASRLIILVVVIFAIFWLPVHIHLLVAYFGTLPESRFYQALSIIWNVLAYSNSCVNPVIYNFASQDFRGAFYSVVCCCCDRKQDVTTNGHATDNTMLTRTAYTDKVNGGEMKRLVSTVKDEEANETANETADV